MAISRVPSPPHADRDKASVAALPRNDIMTQPQGGGSSAFGGGHENWIFVAMGFISNGTLSVPTENRCP